MRASSLLAVALVSLALAQPYVAPREEDSKKQQFAKLIEEIQADVLKSLDEREETMRKRASKPPAIQGTSSSAERLNYIEAVKCLQKLPARTPQSVAAGAKSRPWHRWFLHRYEKALRDECGYKGYQPVFT
uniref:Tyrosinase copper-binding domain-containing protein n=1 Tax=Bionectria ochroleuca TaxID=29856 RepID=A0A0B7KKW5_BIOOC